jgi:CO/xanthine dehydrogenase Mo-binding subunit
MTAVTNFWAYLLSNNLRDFVTLRNTLVHSFIDAHDLESAEGCKAALDVDLARIKLHYADLRAWVEQMRAVSAQMAEVMISPLIRDCIVMGSRQASPHRVTPSRSRLS